MTVRDRALPIIGAALVVAGLIGMGLQGSSGAWWGMHDSMMGGLGRDDHAVSAPPISGATTVSVEATEFTFGPDRIVIKSGAPVNLELVNRGSVFHDLAIPEIGVHLAAGPGDTASTGVSAQRPGEYRFWCTVPGHAQQGMVGTLVIEGS